MPRYEHEWTTRQVNPVESITTCKHCTNQSGGGDGGECPALLRAALDAREAELAEARAYRTEHEGCEAGWRALLDDAGLQLDEARARLAAVEAERDAAMTVFYACAEQGKVITGTADGADMDLGDEFPHLAGLGSVTVYAPSEQVAGLMLGSQATVFLRTVVPKPPKEDG